MLRKRQFQFVLYTLLFGIALSSCVKEWETIDTGGTVNISRGYEISLDTVLGNFGSPAYSYAFTNQGPHAIVYNRVYLKSGVNSPFILNIDGKPGPSIQAIRILKRDSVLLLLQVKINTLTHRDYVRDTLILEGATRIDSIPIRAYIEQAVKKTEKWIWTGATIFGHNVSYLLEKGFEVPLSETVTVPAGTHFYFIRNDTINSIRGILNAQGTATLPIVFSSYRTDAYSNKKVGQWGGLRFESVDGPSTLQHVHLRNATTALTVSKGELNLLSCILSYSTRGIYTQSSILKLSNCLMFGHLLKTMEIYGANVRMTHCALYADQNRGAQLMQINCFIDSANQTIHKPTYIEVVNSIIYGSLDNEIGLSTNQSQLLSASFKYNILKISLGMQQLYSDFWPSETNWNLVPLFTNPTKEDFTLSPNSPARSISITATQAGYSDIGFDSDIKDQTRSVPSHLGPYANP